MFVSKHLKNITALVSCLVFFAASCRKEMPQIHDPEHGVANSLSDVFERFWTRIDTRYQYWDIDTMDWDAMYVRYKPLFAGLDINNEDDQRKSSRYFKAMVSGMLDGHMDMLLNAPAVYDSEAYPRYIQFENFVNPNRARGEAQRTPDYWYFDYYDIVEANYLDKNKIISGDYNRNGGGKTPVLNGTINNNILYLGFKYEVLSIALREPGDNILKKAYNAFRDGLYNNPNLKGVIVDMRGSLGGYSGDDVILASQMIDKRLFRGTVRSKNGPGRLDYTPWTPTYIEPAPGAKAIKVPLIILTDFTTYSGAEYITTALHSIPGSITVGTATGGGMAGNGSVDNLQGKGSGHIKWKGSPENYMDLPMSPARYRFIDGKEYIWGLPPTHEVPFDTMAIHAGRDPQLEKALTLIQ